MSRGLGDVYKRQGRWGTTDDFTTSFLHFSVLHCPLGLGELQACPFPDVVFLLVCLVFFPLSLCLVRWIWPDLMNDRHVHTTAVCVSLQWSGGLQNCLLDLGKDFLVGNMVFVLDA